MSCRSVIGEASTSQAGQFAHCCPSPAPGGLRSWEAMWASGLVEKQACLGMWPCLRRNTGQNPASSVSPWGVDLYLLTPRKPAGNPVLGLPTTSAPHPAGNRPGPPPQHPCPQREVVLHPWPAPAPSGLCVGHVQIHNAPSHICLLNSSA